VRSASARVSCLVSGLVCGLLVGAALGGAARAEEPVVVLRAARLFDGETLKIHRRATVVVRGGRIESVGEGLPAPAGAQVIELGEATLLPGLIESHAHLLLDPNEEFASAVLHRSSADKALEGYRAARTLLEAGFTTVRVLGDFDGARTLLDLRDALSRGVLRGPRILAAGRFIGRVGGHYDPPFLKKSGAAPFARVVRGVPDLVAAVRAEAQAGADWIKLAGTGGFHSGTDVHKSEFSTEELRAAIDEAHRLGKRVAVHAHGQEGIAAAARAGADSIEHATFADEESLRLLAQRGAFIVPTLYRKKDSDRARDGTAGWRTAWQAERGPGAAELIARALKAGVPIAFGTDTGVFPHGEGARQFALLTASGLSAEAALRTATTQAAQLLGLSDQLGRIAPGRGADLIAVRGDPLKDIHVLEAVTFVMREGQVVKSLERK
jgi:imidazolonepropionase-like amidohydrolase